MLQKSLSNKKEPIVCDKQKKLVSHHTWEKSNANAM